MIPLKLHIAGFLSYRDPVDVDFESFALACISGSNGAGKSSLLDAITWALFGEARGKGSDVINLHADVKQAEVALTFDYEGNRYRVLRTLARGKSSVLEFQVQDSAAAKLEWRPLTEKTVRETQTRIEQTLRLDFVTFINASFILQGKADQFTQMKASERKGVLSTILGLEIWDVYKQRTADKRAALETEVGRLDGIMAVDDAELSEAGARTERLSEVERNLSQLSSARTAQESAFETIKQSAALLAHQREHAAMLAASHEQSRNARMQLQARLSEKTAQRASHFDLVARAADIESNYRNWQQARDDVEQLEKIAAQFREYELKRRPFQDEIEVERIRLEQEQLTLASTAETMREDAAELDTLAEEIEAAAKLLEGAESRVRVRGEADSQRGAAREKRSDLESRNASLKSSMNQLQERITKLDSTDTAECPLCGQPLTKQHRKTTLKLLNADGKQQGDDFRANKKSLDELDKLVKQLDLELAALAGADEERVRHSSAHSKLQERFDQRKTRAKEWERGGRKRLAEVSTVLEKESFAAAARKQLAQLDKQFARLGYDAAAHDAQRKRELDLRVVEAQYAQLQAARGVLGQLEDEISNIQSEVGAREKEISELEARLHKAESELAQSQQQAPDLERAESLLFAAREEENRARDELGRARQKVEVLNTVRARKALNEARRAELDMQIARHKSLERAFGRDGVPALLIEQALPQIETKANDLLERLSGGQMSIRFVTQESYKDKKRDDLRETLDIQISDPAGTRDYEMYSGGEAFRVNFAIRLALSEILAQRKGARLQTLVIDEGFGSQDQLGRQRLIEAINMVKDDFAKILVITHFEEMKDAFPNRIEVEKGARGSTVRVI